RAEGCRARRLRTCRQSRVSAFSVLQDVQRGGAYLHVDGGSAMSAAKRFLVYGGASYAVPNSRFDTDLIPGVDIFDNLENALNEFRYRQAFGRTSAGLLCPVWDDEETGGVIEEDESGDSI